MAETSPRPAPYPADTRAKGWRFELDMERVKASDTWLRARNGTTRAALLLLWSEAWLQSPCGSLPNDDELIALILDMDQDEFMRLKPVLMRGWWLAEDGRLYHDVLVERVNEMLSIKERERARKAAWREGQKAKNGTPNPRPVRGRSHGTGQGQDGDGHGSDDTGTGTGSGTCIGIPTLVAKEKHKGEHAARAPEKPEPPGTAVTPAGDACRAMKAVGLSEANPGDPRLLALLQAGVPVQTLVTAARKAVAERKGWGYCLKAAEGMAADALAVGKRLQDAAAQGAAGPGAQASADPESRGAIEAEGVAKGLGPWDERREQWFAYKRRVRADAAPAVAPNVAAMVVRGLAGRAAA